MSKDTIAYMRGGPLQGYFDLEQLIKITFPSRVTLRLHSNDRHDKAEVIGMYERIKSVDSGTVQYEWIKGVVDSSDAYVPCHNCWDQSHLEVGSCSCGCHPASTRTAPEALWKLPQDPRDYINGDTNDDSDDNISAPDKAEAEKRCTCHDTRITQKINCPIHGESLVP